jgi:hypothetical protein
VTTRPLQVKRVSYIDSKGFVKPTICMLISFGRILDCMCLMYKESPIEYTFLRSLLIVNQIFLSNSNVTFLNLKPF